MKYSADTMTDASPKEKKNGEEFEKLDAAIEQFPARVRPILAFFAIVVIAYLHAAAGFNLLELFLKLAN